MWRKLLLWVFILFIQGTLIQHLSETKLIVTEATTEMDAKNRTKLSQALGLKLNPDDDVTTVSPQSARLTSAAATTTTRTQQKKNKKRRKKKATQSAASAVTTMTVSDTNDVSANGIPNKEYNILLMGQTGVGKSTFINAIANYLTYTSLDDANNADLISLIPCQFSISDDQFKPQIIEFGEDANENMGNGAQSATQSCRAYKFLVHNYAVRIIDTPGIGDTRGIEQDRLNLEDIFTFITQYENLHAICILLKPNESKLTTTFQYCITQLLCQLHENASKNIVFVFTNSRNTFYRPGDTIAPLTEILARIKRNPPYVEIPFHKGNTFCLDSEAFRFLVAVKNKILFADDDCENFRISWKKSVGECQRMINYIVEGPDGHGLTPHSIEDTTSVCEARRAIIDLSRPLSENAKLMQDNIQVLNQRLKEIEDCKGDYKKLKKNLYIPILTLNVKELDGPRTVCTGDKCRKVYKVGSLDKYHYPMKCHDPCYLKDVPIDVVGPEELRRCDAMNKQTAMCYVCECHYSSHIHIYYESEVVEIKQVDENIESQLKTKAGTIEAAKAVVECLEKKIEDYEAGHKALNNVTAKLAVFLRQNALVVRNDAFQEYLEEQIENEKSLNQLGSNNARLVEQLKCWLQDYLYEKDVIERALKSPTPNVSLTTKEVKDIIEQLPNMNICGDIISKMMKAQGKTKKKEVAQRDVSVVTRMFSTVKTFAQKLF